MAVRFARWDAVHDDQMDSASGAFAYLAASGPAAGASLAPGPAAALVNRSVVGHPYHAPRGRGIGR